MEPAILGRKDMGTGVEAGVDGMDSWRMWRGQGRVIEARPAGFEQKTILTKTRLIYGRKYASIASMKTTIDLPDDLLHRAKVMAAQRRTTLKALILGGLDHVMRDEAQAPERLAALARVQKGLRLGGKPLNRHHTHERR
jgi:hypothetical protein